MVPTTSLCTFPMIDLVLNTTGQDFFLTTIFLTNTSSSWTALVFNISRWEEQLCFFATLRYLKRFTSYFNCDQITPGTPCKFNKCAFVLCRRKKNIDTQWFINTMRVGFKRKGADEVEMLLVGNMFFIKVAVKYGQWFLAILTASR